MDQSAVNQEAKVNWEYQLAMSQEGEVKLDDKKSLLIYIPSLGDFCAQNYLPKNQTDDQMSNKPREFGMPCTPCRIK